MFFNNKFNTFFGLNLTLVYTFPMCMAWRFHFPIRNYDFKASSYFAPRTFRKSLRQDRPTTRVLLIVLHILPHLLCTLETHSQSAHTCVVGWKNLRHLASVRLTCMPYGRTNERKHHSPCHVVAWNPWLAKDLRLAGFACILPGFIPCLPSFTHKQDHDHHHDYVLYWCGVH